MASIRSIFFVLLALSPASLLAVVPCIDGGPDAADLKGLTVELPPIPLYPADGKIPPNLQNRFVFLDERTYEVVVAFPSNLLQSDSKNQPGTMVTERMPLAIGVCPVLSVSIQKDKSGVFEYRYQLENRRIARQKLGVLVLPLPSDGVVESLSAPPTWRANTWLTKKEFEDNEREVMTSSWGEAQRHRIEQGLLKRRITWMAVFSDSTIDPGKALGPFGLAAKALPGIVTAYFQGSPPNVPSRSEWPLEVSGLLVTFNFPENNSLSLPTVGPKFDPKTEKTAIARDYLVNMEALIKSGTLLETSVFVREALDNLTSIGASSQAKPMRWRSKPGTKLEQHIFLGIQMSLE